MGCSSMTFPKSSLKEQISTLKCQKECKSESPQTPLQKPEPWEVYTWVHARARAPSLTPSRPANSSFKTNKLGRFCMWCKTFFFNEKRSSLFELALPWRDFKISQLNCQKNANINPQWSDSYKSSHNNSIVNCFTSINLEKMNYCNIFRYISLWKKKGERNNIIFL